VSPHRFEFAGGAGFEACRHCGRPASAHPAQKCRTFACDADASVTVFWPGQATPMCIRCALRASNIAFALGLQLTAEPLVSWVGNLPDIVAAVSEPKDCN
jgi:hypothetical protein